LILILKHYCLNKRTEEFFMNKYFTDEQICQEIKQAIVGIARRCGVKDSEIIKNFKKIANNYGKD